MITSFTSDDSCSPMPVGPARLRFIFGDEVMSFPLGERPNLADIAGLLGETVTRRHGAPLAVDVTWFAAGAERCAGQFA